MAFQESIPRFSPANPIDFPELPLSWENKLLPATVHL
jgi:hypothetical protein